ncbi:SseB family protein [Sphingomonas sp.]|uniref:SseB family protein n=1 Tax=Sphingomonas sp. TaxID=28214 RepID=UPI002E0F5B33|nr:SseB family protein [Sphingomonas sp.]
MFGWFKRLFNRGISTPHTHVAESQTADRGPMEMPFVAFQPHNDIEQALMDAAVNPDARAAFHRALLDADLYAATPEAPAFAENRIAQEGERLSLLNVQGPDGAPVAAIFTAQERIVEVFGMDVGFVAIRGEELLSLVANQGAWLNPGFPYSVYWTPSELSAVLGKGMQRTI